MPIYEFFCDKCQKTYEVIQKVTDPIPLCEIDQTLMKSQISQTFIRRGGGLYSFDTDVQTNREEMK